MMKRYVACLAVLAVLLGGWALAEPLRYEGQEDGLAFDLPPEWAQEPGEVPVFYALDGSGSIVVVPTEQQVTPALEEGLTADSVGESALSLGLVGEVELEKLMFAKTLGEDGKLYALCSFGCMIQEVPHILSFYYFTRPDGALGYVITLSVNNQKGMVTQNWLDQLIQAHVPAEAMAKLIEQIGQ